MASTRQTLDALSGNLQESMGVRQTDFRPVLAPAPGKKDIGRRPLRNVGKARHQPGRARPGPAAGRIFRRGP